MSVFLYSIDTSCGHVLRCNVGALQKNAFLIVGRMLPTMVVQGGEIPQLFSTSICQYIQCGFDNCFPTIDEVPDKTVRDSLNKVCNYAFPLMVLVTFH